MNVDDDPIALLERWLDEAQDRDPEHFNAMALATAGADARPSVRFVLARGFGPRGLRFFTSYSSRKARELGENAFASGALYWPALGRQARIDGTVGKLAEEESDEYFDARPRGHQLGAWASEQSDEIDAYETLDERYAHFQERFEGESIARPHSWGGYLLKPQRIEFWERRPNRMHQRIEYRRAEAGWIARRLQP
jgi:pyridoxamine 5'-phosphate oxidase